MIYLMWTPAREVGISNRYVDFLFDITVAGSDRILATMIAAGAIIVGAGLIGAQAMPSRRRPAFDQRQIPAGDERYRDLQQRLDDLHRRLDERERRPVSPEGPAAAPEHRR